MEGAGGSPVEANVGRVQLVFETVRLHVILPCNESCSGKLGVDVPAMYCTVGVILQSEVFESYAQLFFLGRVTPDAQIKYIITS